jgi:hypothetical protein
MVSLPSTTAGGAAGTLDVGAGTGLGSMTEELGAVRSIS